MPGQYRWGVNRLKEALAEAVADGLAAVLLFGVVNVSVAHGVIGMLRLSIIEISCTNRCWLIVL